jgi:hypothetical protein
LRPETSTPTQSNEEDSDPTTLKRLDEIARSILIAARRGISKARLYGFAEIHDTESHESEPGKKTLQWSDSEPAI